MGLGRSSTVPIIYETRTKDLLDTILKQFASDELDLLVRRLHEQPWSAIAEAIGGTAEALRKKLARALERVRDHPELHDVFTD
jgi:hypothetical protein